MEKPKIAVVILNWNGQKLLEQFLPSVVKYSKEATIYVADNASTDDSLSFVTTHFPSVVIIKNNSNSGYAGGYNLALQEVEETFYCLVNSDIEVTENWLQHILNLFEKESKTAIIQPKILDFKKKNYFEYAGAGGGFIDKYGYPFCRGRIFETLEQDFGQYDDTKSIFWATGACFFIRKNVFRELGGFDTDFFAHQEEIDLCWRAFNFDYEVKYCGESTVYHVGGATLETANPKKTFLNFRNSLLMLLKNLPNNKLISILFIRMILDGIAGIRFLVQGKFTHFLAVLRAHFSFYSLIFKFYKKRASFQKNNYFKLNSIIYNYFIKKKLHF